MVHSYKDLIAWKKAMRLVCEIYRITRCFPKEELFGLAQQMRRAAVSIPSNLAEGQGRLSTKDFRHFVGVARGSAMELETQLLIARELSYLKNEHEVSDLLDDVCRLLSALEASLNPAIEMTAS